MAGKSITTKEASGILSVTDARIRQLIKEKRLVRVEKKGRDWLLDQKEVKAFGKQPKGKRGTPRRRIPTK